MSVHLRRNLRSRSPESVFTFAEIASNDEIAMAAIILSVIAFLLGAGFGVLIGGW